jgi:putative transposase
VTQRGNRRQTVFFRESDYSLYERLLRGACRATGVEVWAYCLMPNHVHLILVPRDRDGLRAALAEAHRRYTAHVNAREGWTGYLWQGRFASFPMDDAHLLACARYVEQNPVRARLVSRAQDWPWSSAIAHLEGRDDSLVRVAPLLARVPDWSAFLAQDPPQSGLDPLRSGSRTGRPVGSPAFVEGLEARLGRTLARKRSGPKPRLPGAGTVLSEPRRSGTRYAVPRGGWRTALLARVPEPGVQAELHTVSPLEGDEGVAAGAPAG